jgi:CMP-N,N'-diacetyllegionaminic acid synthase
MRQETPKIAALIPARAGSKRVPGKNVRLLQGHPLIAYTIAAAIDSGIFSEVIVSTDSPELGELARHYGAEVPFLRPTEYAMDTSPDIEWVQFTLHRLQAAEKRLEAFSILRPTSPFRLPETIRRAWAQFLAVGGADSLRAVELCKQHPGKMWVLEDKLMRPLLDDHNASPPWHSTPYQALPTVYAQNASLEIAWTRVPIEHGTIAGKTVVPFLTKDFEGYDINKVEDWWLAETILERGLARLPEVRQPLFSTGAALSL